MDISFCRQNLTGCFRFPLTGEHTQGVENLFGIPPLLVLDSRPFHLPVVDEIVYVDR